MVCSKWLETKIIESEIHNEFWGSDHCPISAKIDFSDIDLPGFISQLGSGEDGESEEIEGGKSDLEQEESEKSGSQKISEEGSKLDMEHDQETEEEDFREEMGELEC